MNPAACLKTGPTANHTGGWRPPEAAPHDIFEPTRYKHLARVPENARFFANTFGLSELQRRGLFRTEYAGVTLRENLLNP